METETTIETVTTLETDTSTTTASTIETNTTSEPATALETDNSGTMTTDITMATETTMEEDVTTATESMAATASSKQCPVCECSVESHLREKHVEGCLKNRFSYNRSKGNVLY